MITFWGHDLNWTKSPKPKGQKVGFGQVRSSPGSWIGTSEIHQTASVGFSRRDWAAGHLKGMLTPWTSEKVGAGENPTLSSARGRHYKGTLPSPRSLHVPGHKCGHPLPSGERTDCKRPNPAESKTKTYAAGDKDSLPLEVATLEGPRH